MTQKLETDTSAALTIQAWKDQAREAGLSLKAPSDPSNTGDYPEKPYEQLRKIRRIDAMSKEHTKQIQSIHRQLVEEKDKKTGRLVKREYITYNGYFSVTDHRGLEFSAYFEIGKHEKPKIIPNGNLKYDQNTGLPVGNLKTLSGSQTIYTIEVPKTKEARKKQIDDILGDQDPNTVQYYYKNFGINARRDNSFSYEDLVNCSIEELADMSAKGGGSKSLGYHLDKDGMLRDREGNKVQR